MRNICMVGLTDRAAERLPQPFFYYYLPVDASRPVNQVAEFSTLMFGLKEKEQFSA